VCVGVCVCGVWVCVCGCVCVVCACVCVCVWCVFVPKKIYSVLKVKKALSESTIFAILLNIT